jgi:hypothetical protein
LISDDESMMLCFSIWGYMDYLAQIVKMDDPTQIKNKTKSIIDDFISEYTPELEFDTERS